MTWIKKLYRRGDTFFKDNDECSMDNAGPVYSIVIDFEDAPGWVAFDIRCQVANQSTGSPGAGYLTIVVDDVEKARYRSSWQWVRHYIYMGQGEHEIKFTVHDYGSDDSAQVRHMWAQYFNELTVVQAIEQAVPPKPMEEINPIPILNGYSRYQGTGPRGTQIEFTAVIKGAEDWKEFMAGIQTYHILIGSEGLYGGIILPQELDQIKLGGDLYLVKCVLHSASQAGVGD